MKIVSLNVNGFFKGQDNYDFDKFFKYIKIETEKNKEIIFCIQEFRVRKEQDVCIENIKDLFKLNLKMVLGLKIYTNEDLNEFLKTIESNKNLYTINLILVKLNNNGRLEIGKYNDDIRKASDEVKYRFTSCRVHTNGFFYLFNLHLISSQDKETLISEYIEILNKIVDKAIDRPDRNLLIGDFNYATNEDRQHEVKLKKYYEKTEKILNKINENGFADIWREQHQGIKDFTYYYDNDINNGRRLDYIFASKKFCEEYSKRKLYISHEQNILWDRYLGFTDHSALVLVF